MNRREWIRALERRLGKRRLIYFGTRGADARTLTDVDNFDAIFSQIAPSGLGAVEEMCLETMKRRRVDLDTYSIDDDRSEEVAEFRKALLIAFDRSAAVLPYRSTAVLSAAWFPRSENVLHLGLFHEKQACFEHKPWVETQLAARGVRIVPWKYYTDDERPLIEEALGARSMVVRANRSDGGTGVRLVSTPAELQREWPEHPDGFVAVAPYLDGIPLNANGCVFPGGGVSVHGASLQLIGIEGCTDRRFGYCGNDFGAVGVLGTMALDSLDRMTREVGMWLATEGYVGAFGIDALFVDRDVLMIELNPRFQGSSRLAAALDASSDRVDLLLAHTGAHLGMEPPDGATRAELAREHPPRAHVVVHASRQVRWATLEARRGGDRTDLQPAAGVVVERGAMLADVVVERVVTSTGRRLDEPTAASVHFVSSRLPLEPPRAPEPVSLSQLEEA